MPWTPVPKFPEVIENLKKSGRKATVGQVALEEEVIRTVGVYTDKTVSSMVRLMERLGYIHKMMAADGTIIWAFEKNEPKKIDEDEEKAVDKKLDNLTGGAPA